MAINFGDASIQSKAGILQIRRGQMYGRNTTTSSSYVDTGLQATMQCSHVDSRVLIIVHAIFGGSQHGEGFYRLSGGNSDQLIGESSSSRERCLGYMGNDWGHGATAHGWAFNASHSVVCHPNSTSNLAYKLQFKGRGSTVTIGADYEDPSTAEGARCYSSIILMELSYGAWNQ